MLAAVLLPAALCAQVLKHWVGGAGAWSEAAHWSLSPAGPGGAGMPRANEDVLIAPGTPISITLDGVAECRDLRVDARHAELTVIGAVGNDLHIHGGWVMAGEVDWKPHGQMMLNARNAAVIDLHGIVLQSDVVLEGSGTWDQMSAFVQAQGTSFVLRRGTMRTNGGIVRGGLWRAEGNGAKQLEAQGSIFLVEGFEPQGFGKMDDPGTATVMVAGNARHWDGTLMGEEELMRSAVNCGTGAGQIPFTVNASVLSNYNGFGVSCNGVCDATVTVVAQGGTGNFAYQWQGGGPTTPTWANTCAGNKLVIVTDVGQNVGCFATVLVTPPPPLGVIFFGLNPPTCASSCNGTAVTFPGGGTGFGYVYDWNNGTESDPNPTQLCAGVNTLELTDANNCVFDTTFTIDLLPLDVQFQSADASCAGDCDGSASVVVSGGTPGYTYNWEPGAPAGDGTPSVTGLCAGNYTLTVADANGCDTTLAFAILQPPPIVPNLVATSSTCADACTGTATSSPAGALGPFTFLWSPAPPIGQGTNAASGLCPGPWSVLITDQASGCDTTVAFIITSPPPIVPNLTTTDATCANSCDGTATASPTGGDPGYTFLWTPAPGAGQGTPNATGLCPGNYTLLITDVAGCDTLVPFTINAPPPLNALITITPISCAGACDGAADVLVSGGVPPYSFTWTPVPPSGQGTPNVSDLCAGNWSVLIADANGCDTTIAFTLTEPPPLDVISSQTNVSCGGFCDGTATVVVTGGTPAYTYVWTPAPGAGQGTPNATGLCAGAYSVLITDANGCTVTVPFTILDAVPLQLSLNVQPASCPGVCDGSAGVIVTGGVQPYIYAWSPAPGGGQGTPNATGLCPGPYLLTVADAVGCDTTIAFTIDAPEAILPNETVLPLTCANDCNGAVLLSPSGGTGAYTYVWTPVPPNGQGQDQATGLCAGTWSVTITSGACDTTLTIDLIAPPPLDVQLVIDSLSCTGDCDAEVTANVTGGLPAYVYVWDPPPPVGQGTPTASGYCAGNYTLTVTDAAGCDTTIAFTIMDPLPLDLQVLTTEASCGGACDGTATATLLNATGPVVYDWQPPPGAGQGTPAVTGLCPGGYTVVATDSLGCDVSVSFTISTPSGIVATAQVTPATCESICDGAIDLTVTGGVPSYTYAWTPTPPQGDGTANVFGLCAGDWTVVISDQAQCDTVLIINVPAPPAIAAVLTATNETCNGPCDGTASVQASGGQPGYTFVWAPQPPVGQGTANATGLCAGNWAVTVSDQGGCDTTITFTILPEQPIDPGLVLVEGICYNECQGSATVNPTGGTAPYTILWSPAPGGGQGTPTATGLCQGIYTVTVTDAVGCDTTVSFDVVKPPPIAPSLNIGNETCDGPCTGGAAVFPTGGTGNTYTFLWQPAPGGGQGTNIATGLCAGITYSITVTDSVGCDTTETFTIQPFVPILANISSTPVTCAGQCDGTATAGPTGGDPPYAYAWSPAPGAGQGTPFVSGLCAGVYSVTITDFYLCDTTVTVLITGPSAIDPVASVGMVSCAGACDGDIVLNPTGGTGNFQFLWNPVPPNGQGTNAAFNLCPGIYAVTITDDNGCDTTASFLITEPAPLILNTLSVPSECQVCIGEAAANASGGTSPYTYAWTDQGGNAIGADSALFNLCAGVYTVLVTDAAGCQISAAVPITDSDGEVLTITDGSTTCPSTCDGEVSVQYVCGDPPCTVLWFDAFGTDISQPMDTASNLCPGMYLVEVTNVSGCVSIDTAFVVAPAPIVANLSSTPVTCAGQCDGTATVGPTGGVGPYTFDWTPDPPNLDGTPQATGLCAGVYDVLITDQRGCDTLVGVLILGPQPIAANATVDPVSCAGSCDASIVLNAQGGSGTLTYFWSPVPPNGQGTNSAFNLCPGTWAVTVADAFACDSTFSFTITDPPALVLAGSSTESQCQVCNGTVTVDITGGVPAYQIAWTDAGGNTIGNAPTLAGLCAGLYTVTVTDASGCSAQLLVPVEDANGETLVTADGQTTCANTCDGQLSVQFICNAPPCGVVWVNALGDTLGTNTLSIDSLCSGDYYVLVTNGPGCLSIDTATVAPGSALVPNLSTTPVSCAGTCDGTATVGPTGGTGPYTFNWAPDPITGDGTAQASGLCAGAYDVLITDQGTGCDTLVGVLILEPQPLTVNATIVDAPCAGVCAGSIVVNVQGGTPAYTYAWTPVPANGDSTNAAFGLCAGNYTLIVSDANGCDTTLNYTVAEPLPLVVSTTTVPSECGSCIGEASAQVSGGTAPYSYLWTLSGVPVSNDSSVTGLCAGSYVLLVQDGNGCQAQQVLVPISDSNGEVLTVTDDITSCPGVCDGEVAVSFNCSDPPCTLIWTDDLGIDLNEPASVVDSLCVGTIFAVVTNASGCISIEAATVTEPLPIVANLSTSPASCAGTCDGAATVAPTGGLPPFTYDWVPDPPNGDGTMQATGLCAGNYDLLITDSLGCSLLLGVLITEPLPVTAAAVVTAITCNGACDATIVVTPAGGNGVYTYDWTPDPPNGDGTNAAFDLCAATWQVLVADSNGCDTTYSFTITDPPLFEGVLTTVDVPCFGDCVGTASIALTGGTAPYTIVWTDAGGTAIAQDTVAIGALCAGDYTMTATDSSGCPLSLPFTITEGAPIDPGFTFTNETCLGPCDGTATVSPTGGVGGFSFLWQPQPGTGQGTAQAGGLCPGIWSVLIADSLGCDTMVSFTVLPFAPILPNATITDVLCNSACNGTIILAPTGGFGNYTYLWSPPPPIGQGTEEVSGLCAGGWTVTITDGIGCDTTVTFTIVEPPALTVQIDQVAPASCNTANDGAIAITFSGGVGGITVAWAGPNGFTSAQEDPTGLFPGLYTVIVTDANGCTATANATVDALVTVLAAAGSDQIVCAGGAIVLDGSASTGSGTVTWTDAQNNVVGDTLITTLNGLPPGSYVFTLTLTDGLCTSQDQVAVTVLDLPIADAGADRTIVITQGTALGGDPSGPTGSIYVWQPDSLLNDPTTANPLTAPEETTWFILTVTAPNGCVDVDSVLVTVVPEIVIPSGFTPNGDGWNDTWQLDQIDQFPEAEVEVYSRWGELLFQSVGYKTPWDGTYNGGLVPVGTYYYAIRLNHPDFPDPYTGPLTVIR
ncbi:MAG: gliding motility-associated C-terminal domain-containing protein [Flavobacteriales bacterium]|nr:gliding motility-associated C-terminal domain-containing protein [Flavobacteriales bacterium]